jgi:voltage-gated potassium channel
MFSQITAWCRELHYGTSESALRGRFMLVVVDVAILTYFVATTFMAFSAWVVIVDYVLAAWLMLEFLSRMLADDDRVAFLSRFLSVVDIAIIVSLLLPAIIGNFAFLRVIRALRLARSYVITRELRRQSRFFARNEDVIFSALNLIVFIFVVAAFVFVLQAETNPDINNYIDALYFTITTLTTTGFGDITLVGSTGRVLAIVIMIVGVALFIRLVQAIFRPNKVKYECPTCGLMRHEFDAVHCKHCGHELHIRTEGAD